MFTPDALCLTYQFTLLTLKGTESVPFSEGCVSSQGANVMFWFHDQSFLEGN